jgi:pSer/pThr/pTyr-binding forkhead associated (FHA) protein
VNIKVGEILIMDSKIKDKTVISRKPLVPILEVISNQGKNKIYRNILSECIIIGRSRNADIFVDDYKLSRNHFMIVRTKGYYEVKDLNSTNGIVVNGSKVNKVKLLGNDKISAGNTSFNFILTRDNAVAKDMRLQREIKGLNNFQKNYSAKKETKKRSNFIKALVASIFVFVLSFVLIGNEKQAKVAPVVKKEASLNYIYKIESELKEAKLDETNKIKAKNLFKMAEHHFKYGSYELAKKSIESYFMLVPNSKIAPSFISACDEALSQFKVADNNLEKIEEKREKRELVKNLLRQAQNELNKENYSIAINIFSKIIEIDPYNMEAYYGVIESEKAQNKNLEVAENFDEEIVDTPEADLFNKDMNKAYKNNDFNKAYYYSLKIQNMGEEKAGGKNFLNAIRIARKINVKMNRKFRGLMKQASLLTKSDAEKEALDIYRKVLRDFRYHSEAKRGVRNAKLKLHKKAKNLYARALVAKSYSDFKEEKSYLQAILNQTPSSDKYHKEARVRLNRLNDLI